MSDEVLRAIGKLEGKVDMLLDQQKVVTAKLDSQDARLRGVEAKGAVYGTIGGGMASVGISLLIATLKSKAGIP